MTRLTPLPERLALCVLGALLVVGCVPAPGVTTLPTAPTSTSSPMQVQSLLKAEIERAALEPSSYHEVELSPDGYFEPFVIAPLSERANLEARASFGDLYLNGLIPDPYNPGRFTRTEDLDDPRVTQLGYYPDWQTNFSPALVVERGGVAATRVGYGRDEDLRLAFPQATSGPLSVRGGSPEMGIVTYDGSEAFVQRELTVAEELLTPLEGAKDAVVVFTVTNLDGEPINGLTKDLIRFRMYDADNGWEGESGTPYEKLEAIGEGKYQIREPFSPYRESGKLRFEVEVVAPELPIQATFYRR